MYFFAHVLVTIEAEVLVSDWQIEHRAWRPTFQELLARIFSKEGIMLHWSVKIVEHEVEDRLDIFFGISRVVSKSCILEQSTSLHLSPRQPNDLTYPFASSEYQTRKEH